MDNITIDVYNKNAAEYANLDIDNVSLKAYRDFSSALPKKWSRFGLWVWAWLFCKKNF